MPIVKKHGFIKTLILTAVLFLTAFSNGAFSQQINPAAGPHDTFTELSADYGAYPTQARLITDNVEAWYARWHVISNARRNIDITYFIVDKDVFGMSMLGLLLKKAQEGVKIRLMMDARGTAEFTKKLMGMDYLQELVEFPNVEIKIYNPISSNLLSVFGNVRNIISSNHDKILIADDEWAITGGRNIEMNYFVDPRDVAKVYRDTDVVMKGAGIVKKMKDAFEIEYNSHSTANVKKELFGNFSSKQTELEFARRAMNHYLCGMGLLNITSLKDGENFKKYNDELAIYKNMQSYSSYSPFCGDREHQLMILDKESYKCELNQITPALVKLIKSSKKEIIIQNPYIIMTKEALDALGEANSRGVAINIHTNSPVSTDSGVTQAFFIHDWPHILAKLSNCRIFAFNGERQLHSKIFVFDREVAVIGTYNMDPMSQQINSELVSVIDSKTFAVRLALRVLEDEKQSVEYKIKIEKDGAVKIIYGPEMHTPEEKLKKLNWIHKLGFLRPLI